MNKVAISTEKIQEGSKQKSRPRKIGQLTCKTQHGVQDRLDEAEGRNSSKTSGTLTSEAKIKKKKKEGEDKKE